MKFIECPKCSSADIIFDPTRYCYQCYKCGHKFDPEKPFIPFTETHITGPIIVIDITFASGVISRMHYCYSFTFENNTLTLVKDIAHKHKETIENVSKMEVVAIQH